MGGSCRNGGYGLLIVNTPLTSVEVRNHKKEIKCLMVVSQCGVEG